MWVTRLAVIRLSGEPAEANRGLAAREAPRRHDEDAVVIGRADVALAVAADDRAGARDHLETAIIVGELEAVAGNGDGIGDGDDALRPHGGGKDARGLGGRQHARDREKAPGRLDRHVGGPLLPVLAALDEERRLARSRIAEAAIVAHAAAGGMAGIADDDFGHADAAREIEALLAK